MRQGEAAGEEIIGKRIKSRWRMELTTRGVGGKRDGSEAQEGEFAFEEKATSFVCDSPCGFLVGLAGVDRPAETRVLICSGETDLE